jgi:hypothetical protein
MATSAVFGGWALARSAHAAGSDQIKIALIGCGGRGVGAARNCLDVRDNIKLVAVADAFEDNARRAAESLKKAYGDKVDLPTEWVFYGFDTLNLFSDGHFEQFSGASWRRYHGRTDFGMQFYFSLATIGKPTVR